MGMRVKVWNAVSRVLFLLAFAASAAVFWFARTGGGYLDLAINGAFDVVAALFIIIYFEGCARPLSKVAVSLMRVTDEIRVSRGKPDSMWDRFSREQLFANRRLDERYDAYVREVMRQQEENDLTADCDIEDYIGEQLIFDTVSKSFCDQMSGIMTGLGILFTFIGLVYGLRNFDASSVDVMQTSTQALMAGIKIAFLTSIFGLVYSLLFGLCYKKLLRQSMQALYDFQDAYAERVRPSREHTVQNTILRLQEEQIETLEQFGSSVGQQVGQAVVDVMQPVTDTLQRTISQYVTVAIEDQRAGMERVVRYFLNSMNGALGNMFSQLKSRTEELARWEREMTVAVRNMMEGIGSVGQGITQAQGAAGQITDTMTAYTDAIQQLTEAQTAVVRDMQELTETYGRRREEETALLQSTAACARTAAENMDGSLQEALTRLDETASRFSDCLSAVSGTVDGMTHIAGDIPGILTALDDSTAAAAKAIDGELKQLVKALSDTRKAVDRFNADLPRRVR